MRAGYTLDTQPTYVSIQDKQRSHSQLQVNHQSTKCACVTQTQENMPSKSIQEVLLKVGQGKASVFVNQHLPLDIYIDWIENSQNP